MTIDRSFVEPNYEQTLEITLVLGDDVGQISWAILDKFLCIPPIYYVIVDVADDQQESFQRQVFQRHDREGFESVLQEKLEALRSQIKCRVARERDSLPEMQLERTSNGHVYIFPIC